MGNKNKTNRGSFTGSLGFILAAAGSAVGLGNIWRFPYLAAKNGGGTFILVYIILALTFGFTLLTTEVAIGRKTKHGPLTAYGELRKNFAFIGIFAWVVPIIIMPYYCAIGGWVLKYLFAFLTGDGTAAAQDNYFSDFITSPVEPVIWMLIFLFFSAFIIFRGVNDGIEKYSRIIMPALFLLVIGIAIFSAFLHSTDDAGVTRTGLSGWRIYFVPDFSGMTLRSFLHLLMDAVGQLFYSISVAMGIMVAYGSYVKDDVNMMKSINQIEFFDTIVAIFAGLMIVPAVYVFMGSEGMSAGPSLMFVSLPKVFNAMGRVGILVGILFFIMVSFAALTSAVSIMEAIIAGLMDKWRLSRKTSTIITTIYTIIMASVVCFGYNLLFFDVTLPNGSSAQILDIMDYLSNSILMPIVSILTCILIGWVLGPQTIIDEVTKDGSHFGRKKLYVVMIKYVAPILLFVLLLQAVGLF